MGQSKRTKNHTSSGTDGNRSRESSSDEVSLILEYAGIQNKIDAQAIGRHLECSVIYETGQSSGEADKSADCQQPSGRVSLIRYHPGRS